MHHQECCYNRKTQLIETTEDGRAGSFIFYSPIFQFRLYKTRDRRPKDDCCILSNLCSTYYSFRPVSRCDNYQPPWIGEILESKATFQQRHISEIHCS